MIDTEVCIEPAICRHNRLCFARVFLGAGSKRGQYLISKAVSNVR